MASHPEVRECVATARPNESGELELAAFVVLRNGKPVASNALRDFLLGKVPEYMVPSRFAILKELPSLPNGKVDRNRLALPATDTPEEQEARALSPTEKILSQIWREVIGLKEVQPHDNFFELGGHSVLVSQIISRVRKMFQVDLSLRAVFESPTIAGLAVEIEEALIEQIEGLPEEEAQQLSNTEELMSKQGVKC